MGFSSVFVSLRNRLIQDDNSRRAVRSSFVAANAHIADGNLKKLKLRSEVVARVTQTTRRQKAVTIQPEQNGPRNWTMVLPYFRIDCSVFIAAGIRLFSIQLVLKIEQSEGNFLPHT
jgi:hypothetical protein